MKAVREIAKRTGRAIALLQDCRGRRSARQGPEQRRRAGGRRADRDHDRRVDRGHAERISTTYDPLPRDVVKGDKILLDDGNLELKSSRHRARRSLARSCTAAS